MKSAPSSSSPGPPPLTAATRHRLQKLFERAQACVDKGDHDYAHQLFTQCVVEDPGSDIYLKAFLDNLRRKYGNSKKGAKLAGLKIKSLRSSLAKSAEKGEWSAAFTAGCAALALNPWDTPSLLALAKACGELHIDECRLIYLRAALDVDGKDPVVNREAALALTNMGQFDQAIACWHRVEQAKPHDEEALQAISRLSVEKTIHQGGYDPELLSGVAKPSGGKSARPQTVGGLSRGRAPSDGDDAADVPTPQISVEQRLKSALESNPADVAPYLDLADFYMQQARLNEATELLETAHQVAGGGDLRVRERLEEVQMRTADHHVRVAQQHFEHDQTEEAKALWERSRRHCQHVELAIFAARAEREPQNPRLQWEWGIRLKKAGKLKEAIQSLQIAKGDTKRKALVLLELGECFQKIEQYKLAQSHYEQAIEASDQGSDPIHKLALYRAGVLSTGLREFERAERHLNDLAGIDFGYRDVAERLDKLNRLRDSD